MKPVNWVWWVARPSREQQAAHDREIADAMERLNAELVKAYKRIADLEAENHTRAFDVLRLTIDDEMQCLGSVRGAVETSDGLILNTAADLLHYLRAIHR